FNSNAFLAATQDVRHDSRLDLRFRRISMSEGTRSLTAGSPPPKRMFSLAASRKLLTILNGPAPFQPAIAWESVAASWKFARYESSTANATPFSATPRR